MPMNLSDIEAAYAAGIVDGEGSIQFTRNRKSRWPSPTIYVGWTDWKLTDRRALQFLEIVRPFLVIRRKIDRCDLLLAEYMACTPRNGRYSSEIAARKRELIERFASLP